MSTKTMRLPPRRISMAEKRKDRDEPLNAAAVAVAVKPAKPSPSPRPAHSGSAGAAEPVPHNRLLAGYLAHEFLTRGTLFGEPWDPARAEAAEPRMTKLSPSAEAEVEAEAEPREDKRRRYVAVTHLLKGDGTHLAGIVNPAQLTGFLKL